MGFQFRIPYATEQGICLVEQGIFWGEQGKPVRGTGKTSAVRVHRMRYESQHRSGQRALLHKSGRVTDRSQSCLNAIEFALTQACPGLTYDSVPHI